MQPPPGAAAAGLSGTYTIVRRFEFSAEKQRNVVVVRKPDGSLHVMAKGSPEMIRKLAGALHALTTRSCWCGLSGTGGALPAVPSFHLATRQLPCCAPSIALNSPPPPSLLASPSAAAAPGSVPADFDVELGQYTREGLRVLGLATRLLAGISEGEVQGMSQVGVAGGYGRGRNMAALPAS